jgi:hypothetical protein
VRGVSIQTVSIEPQVCVPERLTMTRVATGSRSLETGKLLRLCGGVTIFSRQMDELQRKGFLPDNEPWRDLRMMQCGKLATEKTASRCDTCERSCLQRRLQLCISNLPVCKKCTRDTDRTLKIQPHRAPMRRLWRLLRLHVRSMGSAEPLSGAPRDTTTADLYSV